MKTFPRIAFAIVVATFGSATFGQTTTPAAGAISTSWPGDGRKGQSTGENQEGLAQPAVHTGQIRAKGWPEDLIYMSFINFMTEDHKRIQQEIVDAKEGSEPIVEGRSWYMEMQIRPDEFQIIQIYVFQIYERIKENERETKAALLEFQAKNGGAYAASKVPPPPALVAMAKLEDELIFGTMETLKKELGDESYAKLDKFIHKYFGRGKAISDPAKAGLPYAVRKGNTPNSTESPKVPAENRPVQTRDLLVSSSTPGYAMKGTDRDRLTGSVIGKALAPMGVDSGIIEVLISLQ